MVFPRSGVTTATISRPSAAASFVRDGDPGRLRVRQAMLNI
jgi:hypothetical protein